MKKPIQTYALVVCFSSLLAGAIFLGIGLYDLVQMSFPDLTNPYANVETGGEIDRTLTIVASPSRPTNALHVAMAKQSFISSCIALFISIGFFLVHWHLAKKYE